MNRALLATVFALTLAGCSKPKKPDASPAATAGADAPAATAEALGPATPFTQKGVPAGKVVVGYVQDRADAAKCSALVAVPEEKPIFEKSGDHFARIMKGRVIAACPTDHVVGQCDRGNGFITNYSAPKWTVATAKQDCTGKKGQTWLE